MQTRGQCAHVERDKVPMVTTVEDIEGKTARRLLSNEIVCLPMRPCHHYAYKAQEQQNKQSQTNLVGNLDGGYKREAIGGCACDAGMCTFNMPEQWVGVEQERHRRICTSKHEKRVHKRHLDASCLRTEGKTKIER